MFKRLWPPVLLVCALLLSAIPLYATEDVQGMSVQKARVVDRPSPSPRSPMAEPAVPGDDDMPNRTGGHGRVAPSSTQPNLELVQPRGSGWQEVLAGLRQRWVHLTRVFE